MILDHSLLTDARTAGIFARLPRTERIVDVGPGIRPCPAFPCREYVCIEPHGEYVSRLTTHWRPSFQVRVLHGTADLLKRQQRHETTVLLLDVIEHMEKKKGTEILKLAKEFNHAVVFTPLGWREQGDQNPDAWGLNGGAWQEHRSAWEASDFAGWELHVWPAWDKINKAGAILAVR